MENENEDINDTVISSNVEIEIGGAGGKGKRTKSKHETEVKSTYEFVPDYIRDDIIEFIEFRKKIKAPMTEHAVKLLLSALFNLSNNANEQRAILNQSILNNWKGIFPLKDGNLGTSKKSIAQGFMELAYEKE
jgi:hypothetical protein